MKRSKGVTFFAILIILGSLASMRSISREFESLRSGEGLSTKYTRAVDRMLARRNLSPEESEQKRQAFKHLMTQYESAHPSERMNERLQFGIAFALSLLALTAGIGLLIMKPWAPKLTQWHAGLSILFTLWAVLTFSSHQPLVIELVRLLPEVTGDEGRTERLVNVVRYNAMTMYFISVSWNILVLWFFQRPKTKAQFQAAKGR